MGWLKARLESILDNLIFAGIVAGDVAVWTTIKSLPLLTIIGISTVIFIAILVTIRIIWSVVKRKQINLEKEIQPNSLEVNVSKYSLVDWVKKYETLLLNVELTIKVSKTPADIATLQLCIGQDRIDLTSPTLPIKIENSPSSYLVKYEVSVPLIVENEMHNRHDDMTHICIFAMGQEWLSNKFTIPYKLP